MTKRVAIFTHASALEGAEKSLLTSLQNLKENQWEILVIVRDDGPFTDELRKMDIRHHKLRYNWWQTDDDNFNPAWARLNYLSATEATQLIRTFGADLVYTNTSVIAVGALAAALSDIPHIYHLRELADGQIFDKHRPALPAIGKFIGNTSNKIIVNSQATLKSWQQFLPKGTDSEIIYNPIPTPNLNPNRKMPPGINISVIGSITPLKSQLDVLKTLKILCDKGISIKVHFIGPVLNKEYKKELDDYIAKAEIAGSVDFTGYQENPYDLASVGKLVIVPGNSEGFGRVTAESMLAGIPVLAASGGATNELITDDETGYLYQKGNADQLAQKIELLISHPENLESVLQSGKLHIQQLTDSNKSTTALLNLFETVTTEKNPLTSWLPLINPFGNTDEILPLLKSNKLISTLKNRLLRKQK